VIASKSFVAARRALPVVVTILLLFLGAAGPTNARADGGNPNLAHACVDRWTRVRIVGPNDACDAGERSMHWALAGPQGQASQPPNTGQATPRAPTVRQTIQPNARAMQPWGQATQPGSVAPPSCPGKDLTSDPLNCGSCGNQCTAGNVCTTGACVSPGCSAGKPNSCGGACVNLSTDPKNCGACGRACPANRPYCVDGETCALMPY
jgi:hypothetical protein